jgi:hypothetical protein
MNLVKHGVNTPSVSGKKFIMLNSAERYVYCLPEHEKYCDFTIKIWSTMINCSFLSLSNTAKWRSLKHPSSISLVILGKTDFSSEIYLYWYYNNIDPFKLKLYNRVCNSNVINVGHVSSVWKTMAFSTGKELITLTLLHTSFATSAIIHQVLNTFPDQIPVHQNAPAIPHCSTTDVHIQAVLCCSSIFPRTMQGCS